MLLYLVERVESNDMLLSSAESKLWTLCCYFLQKAKCDSAICRRKERVLQGVSKTNPSKSPHFYKLQTSYQSKCVHILKYTHCKLSNTKKKKKNLSNTIHTYLWSCGQNDISTGFPFRPRYYMFILKLTEYHLAALPSTWLP